MIATFNFDYVIYRKDTGQRYTWVDNGTAQGLPEDSLKVVEDDARNSFETLSSWDAGTMTVLISIYEVQSPCLLVRI